MSEVLNLIRVEHVSRGHSVKTHELSQPMRNGNECAEVVRCLLLVEPSVLLHIASIALAHARAPVIAFFGRWRWPCVGERTKWLNAHYLWGD